MSGESLTDYDRTASAIEDVGITEPEVNLREIGAVALAPELGANQDTMPPLRRHLSLVQPLENVEEILANLDENSAEQVGQELLDGSGAKTLEDEEVITPFDDEYLDPNSLELLDEPTAADLEDEELAEIENFDIDLDGVYYSDPIKQYMHYALKHDLLTAPEEVKLAKAMELGDKAKSKLKRAARPSSSSREYSEQYIHRLQSELEAGPAAKERMINSNSRLVVKMTAKYQGFGVELEDLIQDGNIGLIRAVEKFDWRKGYKFSTYATWWIRQAAQRSIAKKSRTIKLPSHIHDRIIQISTTRTLLTAEFGFEPNDVEVAQSTNLPLKAVVEAVAAASINVQSTNTLVGEDKDKELGDVIDLNDGLETRQPATADEVLDNMVSESIRQAVTRLDERESTVVMLSFGLHNSEGIPMTVAEISKFIKAERQTVINLKRSGMAKLAEDPAIAELAQIDNGVPEKPKPADDPAGERKRRGLPKIEGLNDIKSLIAHCIINGETNQVASKKLGMKVSHYKAYKKEMYDDLKVTGGHRAMVDRLLELSIAATER